MQPFARAVMGRGWHCVVVNRRGHGGLKLRVRHDITTCAGAGAVLAVAVARVCVRWWVVPPAPLRRTPVSCVMRCRAMCVCGVCVWVWRRHLGPGVHGLTMACRPCLSRQTST